jgi:hypothetical protein
MRDSRLAESLRLYFLDLGKIGWAVLTGAVVGAALLILEAGGYGVRDLPAGVGWALLVGCLIVFPFIAFHRMRLNLEAQIDAAGEEGLELMQRATALAERADGDMDTARRLLDSVDLTRDRNRVLEDRIRENRRELRAVLVDNNRAVLRGLGAPTLSAEETLGVLFRLARTDLDLLILDGEITRTRGLSRLLDDHSAERAWVERALRFADRAFGHDLHDSFRRQVAASSEVQWPQRAEDVSQALIAARARFGIADLDPLYRPG